MASNKNHQPFEVVAEVATPLVIPAGAGRFRLEEEPGREVMIRIPHVGGVWDGTLHRSKMPWIVKGPGEKSRDWTCGYTAGIALAPGGLFCAISPDDLWTWWVKTSDSTTILMTKVLEF